MHPCDIYVYMMMKFCLCHVFAYFAFPPKVFPPDAEGRPGPSDDDDDDVGKDEA